MDTVARGRRPSLLLIALCLALGYHVWRTLEASPIAIDADDPPTPSAGAAVDAPKALSELPPIDNFAETVARPLFRSCSGPSIM